MDRKKSAGGASEATEEAVLNSLVTATNVIGRKGNERPTLMDLLQKFSMKLT